MRLVLILALFISELAISSDLDILLGQWSRHERPKKYYNETHELIGIEYKGYGFSRFINSENDLSHIIYFDKKYYQNQFLDFGVKYGLVYGYDNLEILPVIVPGTTIQYKDFPFKLDINYVPLIVWTAGFRWSF